MREWVCTVAVFPALVGEDVGLESEVVPLPKEVCEVD